MAQMVLVARARNSVDEARTPIAQWASLRKQWPLVLLSLRRMLSLQTTLLVLRGKVVHLGLAVHTGTVASRRVVQVWIAMSSPPLILLPWKVLPIFLVYCACLREIVKGHHLLNVLFLQWSNVLI